MLRYLAILAFLAGTQLSLHGQSPRVGVNLGNQQEQKVGNNSDQSKSDQRGTLDHPLVVDLQQATKSEQQVAEEKRERNNKEFIDKWTIRLTFAVALAAILQVAGLFFQCLIFVRQTRIMDGSLAATRKQLELDRQTLIQTQRPRIIVRTFYFHELRGIGIVPSSGISVDSMLIGQFYIVNVGGTQATVKEVFCTFYFDDKPILPAKRPYEGESGVKCECIFAAGQSNPYPFGRTVPLDKDTVDGLREKTRFMHILGWIDYIDDLGIRRTTRFCRFYDTALERFILVDDPDYESAD